MTHHRWQWYLGMLLTVILVVAVIYLIGVARGNGWPP